MHERCKKSITSLGVNLCPLKLSNTISFSNASSYFFIFFSHAKKASCTLAGFSKTCTSSVTSSLRTCSASSLRTRIFISSPLGKLSRDNAFFVVHRHNPNRHESFEAHNRRVSEQSVSDAVYNFSYCIRRCRKN